MPRIDRTQFIRHHYRSPTCRTQFSPERQLFDPVQWSSRVIFKPDGSREGLSDDPSDDPSDAIFIDGVQCNTSTTDTIPKPSGQVTRLKRDGYNLQDKLKWKADFYYEVQNYLHGLASIHLNLNSTYTKQNSAKVKKVFDEAKKKYPILNRYDRNWPISDFLHMYLKNASTHRSTKAKKQRIGAETSEEPEDQSSST